MKLLRLIGALLDYPRPELWTHREELLQAAREADLPAPRRQQLLAFVEALTGDDVMDAQERWLGCFDRGRAMSLLLFEHIHGESRDRGQAMVDLLETYQRNGFELATRELPDYLPVVLEYLSTRPPDEVRDWLSHVAHILELLAVRAGERGSPQAPLFEMLVEIGAARSNLELVRRRVADEERDDTAESMDRLWEEEAVRFGADAPAKDCKPPRRLPSGTAAASKETRT
ncbi:MAG: nitrate reductase molybdenum cofactor assembly chaperone [Gammaproteobacteria bacterium]|nr:nitrate reductase molybdenum cofactor assembly chaperone [Gammaproteobacteria bacterium]